MSVVGTTGNIINISSASLAKTNAIRASQGLEPLQYSQPVHVTDSDQSNIQDNQKTGLSGSISSREELANVQSKVTPIETGNEAVSFLKVPFVGNKAGSSRNVQSTTLIDPLLLAPVGIGAGATKAAVKPIITTAAKTAVKTVEKKVAPVAEKQIAKTFQSQEVNLGKGATKTPQTITTKAPVKEPIVQDHAAIKETFQSQEVKMGSGSGKPPSGITPPVKGTTGGGFKSTKIDLGRGQGSIVKIDKTGNAMIKGTTRPATKPPIEEKPKSTDKFIKSGSSILIQKTEQETKNAFSTTPIYLGKGEGTILQIKSTATKAEQATNDYLKELQALRAKSKIKIIPETGQAFAFDQEQIQKLKQSHTMAEPEIAIFKQSHKFEEPEIQIFKQGHTFVEPEVQKFKVDEMFGEGTKQKSKFVIAEPPKEKFQVAQIFEEPQVQKQKQRFGTSTAQRQKTRQITRAFSRTQQKHENRLTGKNQTEETRKRRGGIFPIIDLKSSSGGGGLLSLGGSKKSYVGNVPENTIEGMFKRDEVTYGKVKSTTKERKVSLY